MGYNEVANTNIQKVFELILAAAKKNSVPQEDLPKKLYIISDMEFDYCVEDASLTNFEYAKKLFAEAENAWQVYVEAVVAAYDAAEQPAGTPASAEAQLLRFPLYSTHEQYLAFVIAPHLQYVEPAPMPEIVSAE